jgi:threonyl-tRNA synthetase
MRQIKKHNIRFVQENIGIHSAIELMKASQQDFKLDLLTLLAEKGSTKLAQETGDSNLISEDSGLDEVSLYRVGNFVDLYRGPHVSSTKDIGFFKLHKLSGAYWRGNESNPQLQRIYGLCFETEDEVKAELERLEQVKLRDHRRIGKELGIYHLSEEVGSGLPLWLPNGTIMREELELLAKEEENKYGYQRVVTPHITNEK